MQQLGGPKTEEHETLKRLIAYHTIDIWIGSIGVFLNLCLLSVFFSKRTFLRQNVMLVVLAFGDFLTCAGILFLGIARRDLYLRILEHGVVPVETAWTCSLKAFAWLRLWGSILPSVVVLWIGIERLLAVLAPIFYRDNVSKRRSRPCIAVILYAAALSLLAIWLAFSRQDEPVAYFCGRKAAFGSVFSTYIYVTAITGYVLGLVLNFATFTTLCRMYSNRASVTEINRQLRILRYVVLISFISTIAVLIPNLFSLFTIFYGRINITISESGSWLLGVKSSVNIFIYFALKTDFRNRIFGMFGIKRTESIQASNNDSPVFQKQKFLNVDNNCHVDSAATEELLTEANDKHRDSYAC
ncbi:G-PROTEIN-RECEP-F1-2 domain-containing protein [Aphelenchoides bicaudatus]|nr:G-PROTEIN-RECEP-F1-2 domain-containing protein [Aphelenchoides bicaudatus]